MAFIYRMVNEIKKRDVDGSNVSGVRECEDTKCYQTDKVEGSSEQYLWLKSKQDITKQHVLLFWTCTNAWHYPPAGNSPETQEVDDQQQFSSHGKPGLTNWIEDSSLLPNTWRDPQYKRNSSLFDTQAFYLSWLLTTAGVCSNHEESSWCSGQHAGSTRWLELLCKNKSPIQTTTLYS